jgi:hypothetical protein
MGKFELRSELMLAAITADRLRLVNRLETAEATLGWLQTHFLSVTDLEQIVTHQLLTAKLACHLFAD